MTAQEAILVIKLTETRMVKLRTSVLIMLQKTAYGTVFYLIVLLVCGCNYRIYTNGRLDHKEKGLTRNWQSINENCFVFEKNDKLPDSATLINTTSFYSPFVWLASHSPHYIMTSKAMSQAKTVGANIIQVTDDGATKFTRYRFITHMYYLKEPFITQYKNQRDSLASIEKKANEPFCVVHLKSYMYKWDNTGIYFNDSLSGNCKGAARRKGGFDIQALDLKFPSGGILSDRKNHATKHKYGIALQKGSEYYIDLVPCKSENTCFVLVKKEEY
jgi:hypothetical protein